MESKQRPKAVDHAWSPPSAVKEGARAKDFELAIEWLKGMRLSMSPYREQDWLDNYPLYSVSAILG